MNRTVSFLVPGSIETVSGGYGYDRRVIAGLRGRGWTIDLRELDDTFPQPDARALTEAARSLAAIPSRTITIIDGLALGAMPEQVHRERDRLDIFGMVHHPLGDETGLDRQRSASLIDSEREALRAVRAVIVTSERTGRRLREMGVECPLIVARPGTEKAPLAVGSGSESVELLSVASVIPRKGYDVLVRALGEVRCTNWHLTCAGSTTRDPELASDLYRRLESRGISSKVSFPGEIPEKDLGPYYAAADVFVLPTIYEGYGMAVAEALARGLPVISTPTGGIDELLDLAAGESALAASPRAGVLVPIGDAAALAAALTSVLVDERLRRRLAEAARVVRDRLPTWDDCCDTIGAAIERIQREQSIHG